MATSITAYGAWGGPDGVFRLRMTIDRTAVNVANNTSTVRSRVWVEARGWGSFSYNSHHLQYIDGVKVYDGMIQRSVSAGGEILILSNARTVTHNATGNRNVNSAASLNNPVAGTLHVSTTLTLDTIPRATTPSSGDFTTGTSTTINLPRASSGFTHAVTYKIGGKSGTIASAAGASVGWNPPHDLATEFKNSPSGTVTITVVTKSGSTNIGTKTMTKKLSANASIVPTISSVTWTDTNTQVASAIGAFVQEVSLITGAISSAGVHGSSIADSGLVVAGTAVPVGIPISISGSGSIAASGQVTDSRGRKASRSAPFTVLAYEPPRLGGSGYSVNRANSSNVLDPLGTYLRIDLHALVSSLKVGTAEKNAMTIVVETRPASGGVWTKRNTIKPGLTHNKAFQVSGGAQYPVTSSFEVMVTVTDNTGIQASQFLSVVPTATVTLDLNGANVGVGKYHERGGLDVQGEVYSSEGFIIHAGATKRTLYGSESIMTEYGQMGYGFRGTTAQQNKLTADGVVGVGLQFYNTDNNTVYTWAGGRWYGDWEEVTIQSPFRKYGASECVVRRIGEEATLRATFSTDTANYMQGSSDRVIAKLPDAGYSPPSTWFETSQGSSTERWQLAIFNLDIRGARYSGTHSANVWLPATTTWPLR